MLKNYDTDHGSYNLDACVLSFSPSQQKKPNDLSLKSTKLMAWEASVNMGPKCRVNARGQTTQIELTSLV